MNGTTVYVCLQAGKLGGWDPRRNSTQHKDWFSAAAVTHGQQIKIYMYTVAMQESTAAECDICL